MGGNAYFDKTSQSTHRAEAIIGTDSPILDEEVFIIAQVHCSTEENIPALKVEVNV